jgi:aspartyl-tRNA(Asn)/glutamyl-tRNA(Gln) amidotransferase subunit B
MEIVSEPDLRSAEEGRQYLTKLRSILQYLGVSTGNMEEGSFRCDANISLRPEGSSDSTAKVEVKNMNSFKAVYLALEYENKRQRKVAAEGGRLVQETRGWVEEKGETVSQRSKEYAHDYRYFAEPDLPPLVLDRESVETIGSRVPELPEARRDRFVAEYGLPLYDANLLTSSRQMADYEEDFVKIGEPRSLSQSERAKLGSNWILGEVSRILNAYNMDIVDYRKRVSPERLARLSVLNSEGAINTATAKAVHEEMFKTGTDADDIVAQRGLGQISDTQQLEEAIIRVIAANAQAVADFKAGKTPALKFLVGQVMKATRGRANPAVVNEVLKRRLEE